MRKEIQNHRFRNLTWLIGIVFVLSMLIYGGVENKDKMSDKWESWFPEKEVVENKNLPIVIQEGRSLNNSDSSLILTENIVDMMMTIMYITIPLVIFFKIWNTFTRFSGSQEF